MKRILILFLSIILITGCATEQKEEKKDQKQEEKVGYTIELAGQKIMVGDDFSNIKENLGSDYERQEVESCAFEGMDTIYTYDDYEIYNYHDADKEKIYTITLLNDNITTSEGVKVGNTISDVVNTYGKDYNDAMGAYSYTKGDTILTFIFENDTVISIEYKLNVES